MPCATVTTFFTVLDITMTLFNLFNLVTFAHCWVVLVQDNHAGILTEYCNEFEALASTNLFQSSNGHQLFTTVFLAVMNYHNYTSPRK